MRKISLWAKHHPRTARVYIIIIKILLAAMAWFVSRSLIEMDIILPGGIGLAALLIFFLAALLYPSKSGTKSSSRSHFYIKQKSCDFTLVACTFIMMVSIINNQQYRIAINSLHASTNIIASSEPTAEQILTSLKDSDKKKLTRLEKRILKQEFKKQLKVFTTASLACDKKGSDQAGWIILTIIVALGLTFLLTALVCSLSCGGAEGIAVVVAILGLAAIIWGTIAMIKKIKRKEKKKVPEKSI